jgi:hypothetical protein
VSRQSTDLAAKFFSFPKERRCLLVETILGLLILAVVGYLCYRVGTQDGSAR